MAYALCFSEDFYYDDELDRIRPSIRPTSVYQAIISLQQEKWEEIARDVFHCEPRHLDPLTVLDSIRETDTCSNLNSPVQVWIDIEGWYDVLVYDRIVGEQRPRQT